MEMIQYVVKVWYCIHDVIMNNHGKECMMLHKKGIAIIVYGKISSFTLLVHDVK